MNSLVLQFTNYVSGRMSRKDYWLFAIGMAVLAMIINSIGASRDKNPALDILPYYFCVTVLFIVMSARRLHDTNNNGWLALLHVIPCLGPLLLFFYMIQAGDVGENQYGPDPYDVIDQDI